MKTTVKHVGSVREWEGREEDSIAHREVIEHWCDGGEVEYMVPCSGWECCTPDGKLTFSLNYDYRIKQREPKPGEVWIDENAAALILQDGGYIWLTKEMTQMDAENTHINTEHSLWSYAAPSVEAYYAREFLKRRNDGPLTCTVLQDAAQLNA